MEISPKKFTLEVSNYRCFEDSDPLIIDVEDGIIAFVGLNNSGKSSALRLFYELRHIWALLQNTQQLTKMHRGVAHSPHLIVDDPTEIYCDNNARPLSVEVTIDASEIDPTVEEISKVKFTSDRKGWVASLYAGKNYSLVSNDISHSGDTFNDKTTGIIINCSLMKSLGRNLSQSQYIGPFRNAINQGSGRYYDLSIGTDFISQWNGWKTGTEKEKNRLVSQVTKDIKNIFNFDSLEISSSADSTTLQLFVNDKPYKLQELGAGISQFIVVLGNIAMKSPGYLLIDEPELSLHPSLQIGFLTALASYVENSVLFATHSIGLARSVGDSIYSFRSDSNRSIVRAFEETSEFAEFLGELSFSTYREFGFSNILFVEGPNDIKTAQQFLRKYDKDNKVVVLHLGGNAGAYAGRESELSELNRFNSKIYVLLDSERPDPKKPIPKNRLQFERTCKKLGFQVCLTERRAIENYFPDRAIKNVLGDDYSELGKFDKLSESKKPWSKKLNWKIAHAMTINEIGRTDIGKFLNQI